MTKSELVAKISEKAGLSKKDAEKATSAFVESVVEALTAGDKVQLVGFGTFEVRHRAERVGHNPHTKAEITIPETDYPVFKAGKSFKESVAK